MSFGIDVHALIQHLGKDQPTVANVEPGVILQLLDEKENLRKANGVGDMTKRKSLRLESDNIRALMSSGSAGFDATRWSRLSIDRQTEILAQLNAVRDELKNGISTQKARPVTDMISAEGVWNKSIIWLILCGVIFAVTLVSLIH
ncbi:MAG: hypothetical protein ACM3SP_09410 [Chloroflexota bacterium]